ncbi:hypothetical protein SLA2020_074430 [Shorea laevis]
MAETSPSPSDAAFSSNPCHGLQGLGMDINLMVIVAAMICALVCALGLNSMLHCVVQCTQRVLTEPREWMASRRLNSGLRKAEMVALPTSTYTNSSSPSSSPGTGSSPVIQSLPWIKLLQPHEAKWLVSHPCCPTCLKSSDSVPWIKLLLYVALLMLLHNQIG